MSVELAVRELGSGRPLILMHGLFGSSRNWVGVQKQLAATHRVLSLDLRNHGSAGRDPTMDYELMAGDVRAFMQAQGMQSADVLGHSMGGKVAMTLALQQPALVSRLIVVDIAPVSYPPHHTEIMAGLLALDLNSLAGRADADVKLSPWVDDGEVRGFLLQNLAQSGGSWSWRIDLQAIDNGLEALGKFPAFSAGVQFSGPALFLCGGASDYVTDARHPAIRERFPHADIQTLPGAGHWPHAEVPGEFVARVRAFLQ